MDAKNVQEKTIPIVYTPNVVKKITIHSCKECPFKDVRFTRVFCGILNNRRYDSHMDRIYNSEITDEFSLNKVGKFCPLEDN
jgi:hypothetical protein